MKRILVTGGAGRFATNIKKYSEELGYSVLAPNKKQMNVTSFWDCEKYFYANQSDFDYVIHAAGLSSPMRRHEEKPTDSIQKNIIGTANVTLHCERFKKKMIYISTNYVYKDSFILRICMNARPFPHDKAFTDVISSHMFNDKAAKITLKLLDEVGIVNVGGEAQSVYDFAVQEKPDVSKGSSKEVDDVKVNPNCSMNVDKMKSLL